MSAQLAVVVTLITLAFTWPTVTSDAKDLPIAVAGPAAATAPFEQGLDERAPGVFDVATVADRAAAVDLIETREVYGAVVLGDSPEILTATAGSALVAQQLAALSPVLAEQVGAPVPVTDVVPLGSGDPRGAILGLITLPLVMGGMIGGILVSILVVGVWRRVTAVAASAVFGGLAVAGVLQGMFGAIEGSYLVNAGIIGLAIFGIASTIVGFVSVVGRRGIAIGPVLFLLIANPIAAAAQPWQMLLAPWGAIGQWMPPGAAAALLRDESYFPRADTDAALAGPRVVGGPRAGAVGRRALPEHGRRVAGRDRGGRGGRRARVRGAPPRDGRRLTASGVCGPGPSVGPGPSSQPGAAHAGRCPGPAAAESVRGDAGGQLAASDADPQVVAGVTSAGSRTTCPSVVCTTAYPRSSVAAGDRARTWAARPATSASPCTRLGVQGSSAALAQSLDAVLVLVDQGRRAS